jgi:hypothetical protein
MPYLTPIIILLMVLFPVLLPAAITALHAMGEWRRKRVARAAA